jgi:hypothetical protein
LEGRDEVSTEKKKKPGRQKSAIEKAIDLLDEIYEGTVKAEEAGEALLKICNIATEHLIKIRDHSKELVGALQLGAREGRYTGGNSPHTY